MPFAAMQRPGLYMNFGTIMDSQDQAFWANQPDRQPSRTASTFVDSPEMMPAGLEPSLGEPVDLSLADEINGDETIPADLTPGDETIPADLRAGEETIPADLTPGEETIPADLSMAGDQTIPADLSMAGEETIPADFSLADEIHGEETTLPEPSLAAESPGLTTIPATIPVPEPSRDMHGEVTVPDLAVEPPKEVDADEWPELDAAMMMAALGEPELQSDLEILEDPYLLMDFEELPLGAEAATVHPGPMNLDCEAEEEIHRKGLKAHGEKSDDEWESVSRGSSAHDDKRLFDAALTRVQKMDEKEFEDKWSKMKSHECWQLFWKQQVHPNLHMIKDREALLAFWEFGKDRYTSIAQVRADAVEHLAASEAERPGEEEREDFIPKKHPDQIKEQEKQSEAVEIEGAEACSPLRHADQSRLRASKREANKEKSKPKPKAKGKGKSSKKKSAAAKSAGSNAVEEAAPSAAAEPADVAAESTDGNPPSSPRGNKRKSEQLINPDNKEKCKKKL